MKTHCARLCQAVTLALLVCFCLSALMVAQDSSVNTEHAVPRFVVLPPKPAAPGAPAGTLQEWNGSFTYNGHNYPFNMVGADPSTNTGAVITTWIIPVKIVLSDGSVWDPLAGGPTGPLARTVLSPIFDMSTTYTQGGVDVGTTQYVDAFQRGNFWSIVQNNNNSHLLLGGPTAHIQVLPEITLNVPSGSGHQGQPFGHHVAEVDINYFDNQISQYLANSHIIMPTGFPIFETANTYLTSNGCCIGGYHSANGSQTYTHFTYITYTGDFSQDVSALSHEVGEWADDPLDHGFNTTPCGVLEVGDPLETTNNFGDYPYQLHNFTYHLQDLVFLRYFGGPSNGSVNSWWSFQNFAFTRICQNGA
jgi:hypothetical protein